MNDSNIICKNFRREMSHLSSAKRKEFEGEEESTTGHYWCLKTMTINGPDSGPVSPEDCSNKRSCFFRD